MVPAVAYLSAVGNALTTIFIRQREAVADPGGCMGCMCYCTLLQLETESVQSELLAYCTGMMLLPSESRSLLIIQTIFLIS